MKREHYTEADGRFFNVTREPEDNVPDGELEVTVGVRTTTIGGAEVTRSEALYVPSEMFTACAVGFLRSEGYVVMPTYSLDEVLEELGLREEAGQ
ncbi:hypothetical protein ACUIAC_00950 [Dermabacteraceae bacterium P13138]